MTELSGMDLDGVGVESFLRYSHGLAPVS
jgi:hypothetical protein